MRTRQALPDDAANISAMLERLAAQGKRTLPSDIDYVRNIYIAHPDTIRGTLAVSDGGHVLGLQILKYAADGNPYGVAPGWGMIGTHVSPDAARQGVGRALMDATRQAALRAGLSKIDATIGKTNDEGLGYYRAMGFETYKEDERRVSKCLAL